MPVDASAQDSAITLLLGRYSGYMNRVNFEVLYRSRNKIAERACTKRVAARSDWVPDKNVLVLAYFLLKPSLQATEGRILFTADPSNKRALVYVPITASAVMPSRHSVARRGRNGSFRRLSTGYPATFFVIPRRGWKTCNNVWQEEACIAERQGRQKDS